MATPEAGLLRVVAGQRAGARQRDWGGPWRRRNPAKVGAGRSQTPVPERTRARPSGAAGRAPAGCLSRDPDLRCLPARPATGAPEPLTPHSGSLRAVFPRLPDSRLLWPDWVSLTPAHPAQDGPRSSSTSQAGPAPPPQHLVGL